MLEFLIHNIFILLCGGGQSSLLRVLTTPLLADLFLSYEAEIMEGLHKKNENPPPLV